MIGETLGNYRIVAKIGKGGMGAVYLAEHTLMGRKAAIKVLLPELSHRPAVVNRLFNEARATARLHHPALVQIYDCGRHEATGSAYLVMDYLEGESLGRRIARMGRLPVGTAVEFARQIAAGMAVAHRAGIVHRDLKPDNVFLIGHPDQDRDLVRILDFGIAKVCDLGTDRIGATATGALLGTPTFMAPEQARGAADVDARADVYSLGCLLFAMVCGRPPFVYRGVSQMISAHEREPPPSPRAFEEEISSQAEREILKALDKDPARRHQSMAELGAALERLGAPEALPRSQMAPTEVDLPALKTGPLPSAPFPAKLTVGVAGVLSFVEAGPGPRGRDRHALPTEQNSILLSASLPRLGNTPVPPSDPGETRALPEPAVPTPRPRATAPAPVHRPVRAARPLTPVPEVDPTFGNTAREILVALPSATRRANLLLASIAVAFLGIGGAAFLKALALLQPVAPAPADREHAHKVQAAQQVVIEPRPPAALPPVAPAPAEEPIPEPPVGRARWIGERRADAEPVEPAAPAPRARTKKRVLPVLEEESDDGEADFVVITIKNPVPGLVVSVDGDEATLPVRLFRDDEPHTLRFHAPGRRPETRLVRADRNQRITLANEPVLILD